MYKNFHLVCGRLHIIRHTCDLQNSDIMIYIGVLVNSGSIVRQCCG